MGEDADTLQREVAQARTQLRETVQALAHKAAAPRRAVRRFGPPAIGLALLGAAVVAVLAVRARR